MNDPMNVMGRAIKQDPMSLGDKFDPKKKQLDRLKEENISMEDLHSFEIEDMDQLGLS